MKTWVEKNSLQIVTWLLVTAVSVTVFAFTHFQSKEDARDDKFEIRSELKEIKASVKSIDEYLRH